MGIKGTVRRSTDGHIIHANIDTDVIIAEEPPYGEFDIGLSKNSVFSQSLKSSSHLSLLSLDLSKQ